QVTSNATGIIALDLTDQFGGTYDNYLDTLRADYAFIITPEPFVKSLPQMAEKPLIAPDWDFTMYPNPARDELFIRLPDDTPTDIILHDLAGRQIHARSSVSGPLLRLPIGQLASGVYCIRVSEGDNSKVKKLIIH
ncbi:MAG: T9SS type A sorting domain-containing protein, partial [Flavobacteriales bacterium]|nr:T9SS type A sorting domain-containing protein [Flavobacteriales bacterium]